MDVTKLGVIFRQTGRRRSWPHSRQPPSRRGSTSCGCGRTASSRVAIATSATALAATTRITVGLGVMPAVFRNPVAAAMEIATLARLHPGRFVAGLGNGAPAWMDHIGALPPKPAARSRRRPLPSGACSPVKASARRATTSTSARSAWFSRQSRRPPVVPGVRRPPGSAPQVAARMRDPRRAVRAR